MKKKLLFVIDSLDVAGAEKSLVTLLSLLDYKSYSVDLLLFSYGHELEKLLPSEVNLLPPLPYTHFSNTSLDNAVITSLGNKKFRMLLSRINYSSRIRMKNYSNPEKARLYWQAVSKEIEQNQKKYDIAIAYAQGVPTFYVAEKVEADKKLAWVNVSYHLNNRERTFQEEFYRRINKVVAVSESTRKVFMQVFPEWYKKVDVMYDINHSGLITRNGKLRNWL